MWSANFSTNEKKKPDFFETKLVRVGSGSGSGLGLGLGLGLVSKVAFWAFFEKSLEPHAGHTKFPGFYSLPGTVDNNLWVQQRWSSRRGE